MANGNTIQPSVSWKQQIEVLKERVVNDLAAWAFGKVGEKVGTLEQRYAVGPTAAGTGGIPVRVQLPTVAQMAPQAALILVVLLAPVVLGMMGRRGRRLRR